MKKLLLILVLSFGAVATLTVSGVKTASEANASVTEAEVVEYLEEYSYQVISASPRPGTVADWNATCTLGGNTYHIWVHVSGSNIVGHEIVP